ncbi:MAG TPA: DUF3558 family protein [Acidimicrobiales bacterium]|nr:DUF3558 family protein [Acidimicrobiales bacterium]
MVAGPAAVVDGRAIDRLTAVRRRYWLAPAVLAIVAAGCRGGGDEGSAPTTAPTAAATATTSTVPAYVLDACEVLPPAAVADVVGRPVTAEAIAALGGGVTCDHRPADAPAEWTISLFVFERDTEGHDIDAGDAYIRFRAETAEASDVPDLGDRAFLDPVGRRVGVLAGDVYLDVTAVRFDGPDDVLVELAARAVAGLSR